MGPGLFLILIVILLLVVRFTNNVVVILASGVRQRKLLRSAAPHALANSAGLVE